MHMHNISPCGMLEVSKRPLLGQCIVLSLIFMYTCDAKFDDSETGVKLVPCSKNLSNAKMWQCAFGCFSKNIRYWLSIDFTLDFISIRSLDSCADIFIPEPSSDCRSQQLNRMSRSFTVASSDRRLTRETQLNVHPLNYVISKNIAPKNPQWECNIWMKTTATLRQHQRKNNWNHISIVEYHEKVAQIMLSLSYFEFRFGVYFFSL